MDEIEEVVLEPEIDNHEFDVIDETAVEVVDQMVGTDDKKNGDEKSKRQVLEECTILVQEFLQRNQLLRTVKVFHF